MNNIIKLLFLTVLSLCGETKDVPDLFEPHEENHILRITAKVLTEDGQPLENADVHVAIENFNDFKDGSNDIRGKTDMAGKFSAEGAGRPQATIIATQDGSYPSRKQYRNWDNIEETRKTGKYIPWDPVIELTLKKIGKPIPMLVWLGDAIKTSPIPGKAAGFDLFEGDWVAPYGNGKISDLLINLSFQSQDDVDGAVRGEIRFGNKDDGLIPIMELSATESLLKYPRVAPEDGYEIKVVNPPYTIPISGVEVEVPEPVGYLFRIRTQKDQATGKILSAFYGKIVAKSGIRHPSENPFQLHRYSFQKDGRKLEPGVRFSYYLNPTANDRNLEYDQRTNLAPGASKGLVYPP
jgi:hypothetical protein